MSLLVRGIDRTLVERLKARARRFGRSLQAELQISLSRAAQSNFDEAMSVSGAWHRALSSRGTGSPAKGSTRSMVNQDRRR